MEDGQNNVSPVATPPVAPQVVSGSDDEVQGRDSRVVPYGRFSEVSKARRDAERQLADAIKERDDLKAKFQTVAQERQAEARAALVQKVARELNVPDALAARLQGDDEAALKADAEALLATVAPKPAPNVDATKTGGNGGQAPAPTFTLDQVRDPAFYQANRDAILAAMAAGRIQG